MTQHQAEGQTLASPSLEGARGDPDRPHHHHAAAGGHFDTSDHPDGPAANH
jgi:hypothetical protein